MKKRSFGFTIVEVLVVIVIIGILAIITIVSYSSITRTVAINGLQSDLKYASIRLGLDNSRTGSYPANLTVANNGKGIPASSGTTYQYTLTPKNNYCLSATSTKAGSASYYVSSPGGTVKSGACMPQSLATNMISYYSLNDGAGLTVADSYGLNIGAIKINAKAYYPFDSNANDTSTNVYNGTVSGATLTNDRFNNANSAYGFNGTTNYISLPALTLGNKYFISAWIKRDASASGWNTILGGKTAADNNLAYNSDGRIAFGNFGGSWQAIGGSVLTDTTSWHHIVASVTSDGTSGTWTLYVDGVNKGTSGTITCNGDFNSPRIGSYSSSGAYFKGSIDEVLIGAMTGSLPTNGDITRLYTLTASHDMNKPWINGLVNGGFDFWGYQSDSGGSVCSYIDMGTGFNSVVNGVGTSFTLAYWAYKSSGTDHASGMQFGWYGGNYRGVFIGVNSTGTISGTVGQGATTGSNSNYDFNLGAIAALNQWNHIAITYNGTNINIYLNGVSRFTYNIGSYVDNGGGSQKLILSKNPWDFNAPSQGKYDEVAVWSRGLSADEVVALYNSGVGVVYP